MALEHFTKLLSGSKSDVDGNTALTTLVGVVNPTSGYHPHGQGSAIPPSSPPPPPPPPEPPRPRGAVDHAAQGDAAAKGDKKGDKKGPKATKKFAK
ncbi:hypothetical protein D9615_005890 [Tricholomella constricta]|uniref:Uncharacterized protein n=1 Tax=Tricholomella constricta TaxID=117010 RepID=A0A8H5M2P4_9AGAR|nr:hypothetical protein D9615_005890 [Tricholomella constricta]